MLRGLFLRLLLVVGTLLACGPASARAETRVGDFDFVVRTLVGAQSFRRAENRRAKSISKYDFASGYAFTGKEEDSEVGLTYFGARYYSAQMGRWISADPLTVHAMGSDPNPYAYVGGRVMSATDPTGLDPITINDDTTTFDGGDITGSRAAAADMNAVGAVAYSPALEDFANQTGQPTTAPTPISGPGAGFENGDNLVSDWVPAPLIGNKYSPYPMGDPREEAGTRNALIDEVNIHGVLNGARAPNYPGSRQYKLGMAVGMLTAVVLECVAVEVVTGGGGTGPEVARAGRAVEAVEGAEAAAARMSATEAESIASRIANGHAFEKHVIAQGEFPMVSSAAQFAQGAKNVLLSPETVERALSGGRTAYWNEASQTVLIHNPAAADLGTFFRPTNGVEYFLKLK